MNQLWNIGAAGLLYSFERNWLTGFELNAHPKPYQKTKPSKKLLKRRAKNKAARRAKKANRQ